MRTKTPLKTATFSLEGESPTTISLPHTWNAFDGQDGGGDYFRGKGTYIINLPNPTPDKKQYIEITGANHVATVSCNGHRLGTHKGGFSTFRYDLTDTMKSENNVLTVIVSNEKSHVYPQSADFTFYGGLYREVNFIEVDVPHFDLLKNGSDAIFVTPRISGKTRIELFLVNSKECEVKVELKDAEGNVVGEASSVANKHTFFELDVNHPHLWDGMSDPYCYTATAYLIKDNEVVDSVSTTYGYRGFHVDPETGFWLNGRSYPLHGVSRHQDRLDKGWALSKEDHEEDISLIKEVGANTIRLAHYQHDQYFYDLCDHTGFVLWAEIPFISVYDDSKDAHDNTISQMLELIAQNYNHPSIFFWGISNEITIGGESEGLFQNLCELNALCKRLDPSRLTTMAQVTMVPMNSQHNYITDILAYNHYYGWYVGDAEDNGPWLDAFHKLNPDRPVGLSEYGAEAVLSWHSAEPENHDYTEEYAAYYHHEMLKTFAKRPYIWGTYVWNMFDFAADSRDEGGVKGRNNKGLVTYDRKTKKDAFYIYQAYWTDTPMIHVCGERFVDRAPNERNIVVYTNCPRVTLVINGMDYIVKEAIDHAVVFEDVTLNEGENTITAKYEDVVGNTIKVNAVEKHNYAYDLPAGNQAANWFDDPEAIKAREAYKYPKGYYSIKDKIGVLLANPETAVIVKGLLSALMESDMVKGMMGSSNNASNSQMMEMVNMMRLSDLLKMLGGAIPEEAKIELNNSLIKIKKL